MGDISISDVAARYAEQGFYFPLDVLDSDQASRYRAELEALEARTRGRSFGIKSQLNHPHVIFCFADAIARNARILDAVESVIGPDIMVWGSTLFIKEPRSAGYVSWHQDLRYWGLDSDALVSAWVALSPVNRANGCMRFVPSSHMGEIVAHKDTFSQDNFLYRGQVAAVDVDEDQVVHVELEPGQASLHHGRLLHASAPNRSDQRRIGLAINYIAPKVRQVVAATDFAVLVRGEDRYGHFQQVPSPREDLTEEALAWHQRILSVQNEAMYSGAFKKDSPPAQTKLRTRWRH